jgi:hypothetical protein
MRNRFVVKQRKAAWTSGGMLDWSSHHGMRTKL